MITYNSPRDLTFPWQLYFDRHVIRLQAGSRESNEIPLLIGLMDLPGELADVLTAKLAVGLSFTISHYSILTKMSSVIHQRKNKYCKKEQSHMMANAAKKRAKTGQKISFKCLLNNNKYFLFVI